VDIRAQLRVLERRMLRQFVPLLNNLATVGHLYVAVISTPAQRAG